jgi:hypothetical protein
MGVLNVTPDSFSDGGRYADFDAAVGHGLAMWAAGADIVDVGGESTRPGAERVDAEEETRRVVPAIRALVGSGVAVSVDTSRAAVAEAALDAGARIVNDVSGGLADPAMAKTIAAAGVPWVLMHWRGHSRDMQALARYDDVVRDVTPSWAGRSTPRSPPASPPATSCSTRTRVRQDRRAQLGAAGPAGRADRARLPGAGRRVPQGVPRPAARRSGRHAGPGRRPRARDGRDQRAGRGDGRLGGAGARGGPDPRRGEGRPRVEGGRPWLTGSR